MERSAFFFPSCLPPGDKNQHWSNRRIVQNLGRHLLLVPHQFCQQHFPTCPIFLISVCQLNPNPNGLSFPIIPLTSLSFYGQSPISLTQPLLVPEMAIQVLKTAKLVPKTSIPVPKTAILVPETANY